MALACGDALSDFFLFVSVPFAGDNRGLFYPIHNLVVIIDESTGGKDVDCWRGLGVCHAGEAQRVGSLHYVRAYAALH